MKKFLNKIEKDFNIVEIDKEVSTIFDATKILNKYPQDVVILNNPSGYDIPIISGLCNTREKIARAINCKKDEIIYRIADAIENPIKIKNTSNLRGYITTEPDLSKLPILTHFKKDGGAYITGGVVIAKDPETNVSNASIHRMLVLSKDKLAIRIVPRDLYTYFNKAKRMEKNLGITIAIGLDPAILLASTSSIPINSDEMELANNFKEDGLKLLNVGNLRVPEADIILEGKILYNKTSEEGPFVDLTDTYDHVRNEPVIQLTKMHIKEENPYYHSILPAGFEHKLLQGLPQEPRIYKSVKNTVPTVQNVLLTEGGCCWLHAIISIEKQNQGDGKNALLATLSAHPSLKHAVVVDSDIDIFNLQDIEYAISTRVKGDDDIIIIPKVRGSSLDPVALPDGTTTKVGVDATKDIYQKEKFERVSLS
ncbi:MAG: UbiD family decarboxylase [Methanobrevibacter sp.]|jgi:UbiD family decarboxylase|nr:UbiD family decarboxylase [Candidatus Methanovirga basalitermitum]